MAYKVGTEIKITYQAAGATTGLLDVTAQILDETESLDAVNFPDITLVENAEVVGEYFGSFTPDVVGTWRVIVDSATKPGQVIRQHDVVNYDVDTVGTAVDGLNDVSTADVNAEVDQALVDYGVAKASDITAPPMLG